jgi:hypothetical protein
MNDFLENSIRLFRFFISSVFGLIITILSPFMLLIKQQKTKWLLLPLIIMMFIFLYLTISKMINPDFV